MLDIVELEKRWSRYRLKKLLPFLISLVVVFTVGVTTSYLYINYPDFVKDIAGDKQGTVQNMLPAAEVNMSTKPVPVKTKPAVVAQNILKPSLTFMYNLEDQVINAANTKIIETASAAEEKKIQPSVKAKGAPRSAVKTKKQAVKQKKQAKVAVKAPTKVAKTQKKQSVKKHIVKKEEPVKTVVLVKKNAVAVKKEPEALFVQIDHKQISENELNSVIKRFEKQNKPALSLFIAKKYYEQGNYKEAYNYALKTNNLNPDIEDSVLIFCRSLVKLGKKEEAVTTLQAYLHKSSSIQASILLNKIQTGKFK